MQEILGDWVDPSFESSLITRCREAWKKPLQELTNKELATFLRQNMGVEFLTPIAQDRLDKCFDDDTEIADDELQLALTSTNHHS